MIKKNKLLLSLVIAMPIVATISCSQTMPNSYWTNDEKKVKILDESLVKLMNNIATIDNAIILDGVGSDDFYWVDQALKMENDYHVIDDFKISSTNIIQDIKSLFNNDLNNLITEFQQNLKNLPDEINQLQKTFALSQNKKDSETNFKKAFDGTTKAQDKFDIWNRKYQDFINGVYQKTLELTNYVKKQAKGSKQFLNKKSDTTKNQQFNQNIDTLNANIKNYIDSLKNFGWNNKSFKPIKEYIKKLKDFLFGYFNNVATNVSDNYNEYQTWKTKQEAANAIETSYLQSIVLNKYNRLKHDIEVDVLESADYSNTEFTQLNTDLKNLLVKIKDAIQKSTANETNVDATKIQTAKTEFEGFETEYTNLHNKYVKYLTRFQYFKIVTYSIEHNINAYIDKDPFYRSDMESKWIDYRNAKSELTKLLNTFTSKYTLSKLLTSADSFYTQMKTDWNTIQTKNSSKENYADAIRSEVAKLGYFEPSEINKLVQEINTINPPKLISKTIYSQYNEVLLFDEKSNIETQYDAWIYRINYVKDIAKNSTDRGTLIFFKKEEEKAYKEILNLNDRIYKLNLLVGIIKSDFIV